MSVLQEHRGGARVLLGQNARGEKEKAVQSASIKFLPNQLFAQLANALQHQTAMRQV